jgi:uncharacterized protein DUF4166
LTLSPFEPDLGPHREELPRAFLDQYLFSPGEHVVLEGTMQRVWRRGRWLWPIFWLASWSDLLFPETGSGVPVTVDIRAVEGPALRHLWRRDFRFSGARRRRFRSRIEYDERLGHVIEAVGPGLALAIAWDVRFEAPSTLHLDCAGWVLRLGPLRIRLPEWLLGSGRDIETAPSPNTIRIDFTVSHPLLGDVFGYVGTFTIRREPPAAKHSPSDG